MSTSRLWRPVAVRPSSLLIALLALVVGRGALSATAADRAISGAVVDQSGQPLPRAYVRLLDASGAEIAAAFADETGRFGFNRPTDDCRIEASMTGFEPAAVACAAPTSRAVRIVLGIAAIRETVIVSATRTEAPAGQVGASVTTFTADDLSHRQVTLVADLLRASAGVMVLR